MGSTIDMTLYHTYISLHYSVDFASVGENSVHFEQVINIINAAQENSPLTVAEALERVLEILRSAELYSPQLASKDDDPHTNDLVGGLMSVRHTRNTEDRSFDCA